jgi:hypothetical protein
MRILELHGSCFSQLVGILETKKIPISGFVVFAYS